MSLLTTADWKRFADMNFLTPSEFEEEIYLIAAALGSLSLEVNDARSMTLTVPDKDRGMATKLTISHVPYEEKIQ